MSPSSPQGSGTRAQVFALSGFLLFLQIRFGGFFELEDRVVTKVKKVM